MSNSRSTTESILQQFEEEKKRAEAQGATFSYSDIHVAEGSNITVMQGATYSQNANVTIKGLRIGSGISLNIGGVKIEPKRPTISAPSINTVPSSTQIEEETPSPRP
jgi:hypothetical protein